jgi:DNA anti-recombination protein RmuC
MCNVRDGWTDERLDELATRVDQRFDGVDRRFGEVDRRLDKIDRHLEKRDGRLGSMQKTMANGFVGMSAAIVAGFVAIMGLIVTRL